MQCMDSVVVVPTWIRLSAVLRSVKPRSMLLLLLVDLEERQRKGEGSPLFRREDVIDSLILQQSDFRFSLWRSTAEMVSSIRKPVVPLLFEILKDVV
jgi:hypothetical protein